MANPNESPNNLLSFPYPCLGSVVRPRGEGCSSCVHATYCPAFYWFRRRVQGRPDLNNGVQCESYSNNPADTIVAINEYDMEENDRRAIEGVSGEPGLDDKAQQSGG